MKFPAFEPIDLKNDLKSLKVIDLLLSQIIPNSNQPRRNFDKDALDELSQSIKQHGVIQPILVEQLPNSDNFQIIAGERRWRASKQAGRETIPAIIREYTKLDTMAISLIENIQRENLNPLEEAHAIKNLLEECAMTHSQIAESIGRSRTSVSNLLRLLNLEDEVKVFLNSGLLEMGHARALLALFGEQQINLAQHIVSNKLSVRETERRVQNINNPITKQNADSNLELNKKIIDLQLRLARQVSSNVKLNFRSKGRGEVLIFFDTLEEAELLIDKLNLAAM